MSNNILKVLGGLTGVIISIVAIATIPYEFSIIALSLILMPLLITTFMVAWPFFTCIMLF